MSGCLGCSCTHAPGAGDGGRLLFCTRVSHTVGALRAAVREAGATVAERGPGLLEVTTEDTAALLLTARRLLSSVEAAEVRALVLGAETGDDLLAAALNAPTVHQLGARAAHADLLPLFADELRAFRSVYQPIVMLDGDPAARVVGYEALLRATGPDGPVMPAEMFAAAADAGWLHVLDRVGRTTALRGASGWIGTARLFVNFLPTTIYRPEVCLRTTEQAAHAAGLRLDQLVFEVTESERITDVDHLERVFAYYRERGCKVALDDLGVGYSSLNLLVRLQPDVVKLDKDIVQRLPDRASAAVVSAVVEITHAYGGQVLAECVETAEQASAARDLGVDLGQGWFFGRPEERAGEVRGSTALAQPGAAVPSWSSGPGAGGNDAVVGLAPSAPIAAPTAGPGASAGRGTADVQALLARAVGICASGVTIADATSPDLCLVYVNETFEEETGYRGAEVLGRNCRFLQGPGTDPEVVRGLREAIAAGRDHVAVLQNYRKDGSAWWNELRLSPVRDEQGQVTHYFGFQNDVTSRVEAEQRAHQLAFFDALTGLPNRTQVLAGLRESIERADQHGTRLAVLFVDLDGFKAVNDRLGHAAGDLALIATAARLRGALRAHDLLGRYSGDEFVAVLADVPPGLAASIAQRSADAVLDSFHSPLSFSDDAVLLGASIGVAVFPEDGADVASLLLAADRAMYAAKAAGRGRAVLAQAHGRHER